MFKWKSIGMVLLWSYLYNTLPIVVLHDVHRVNIFNSLHTPIMYPVIPMVSVLLMVGYLIVFYAISHLLLF